jgi:hypothetical protein
MDYRRSFPRLMCQPFGLRAWWMPGPVVITTGRGCAALRAKTKQPDLCGRSTTCGPKPGGLVYSLPGSKAPVARCIVKSKRPGGPIHRILLATDGHSPDGCASPSGFALGGCPDRWLSPPAEDVPPSGLKLNSRISAGDPQRAVLSPEGWYILCRGRRPRLPGA